MPARNGTWNGSNWIRREKRLAIYLRDHFRCVYCDRNLARVKAKLRCLDHVIPVTKGGTNHENNLVLSCKVCNERKGDKLGTDYAKAPIVAARLVAQLATPINRELGKALLDGTLDLSDVLKKGQPQ